MPEGLPPSDGTPAEGGAEARAAAEALMATGMDLHDSGKLDEAIEAYRRAIDTDPNFVIAHNNLGMVYIDKEELPHAVAALKRAIKVDPAYAEAYNNLGYVHRKMKENALAAAYYEKFLELDPEVDDAPKIKEWLEKIKAQVGELPGIGPDAAQGSEKETAKQTLEIGSEDMTLMMDGPPPGLFSPPPEQAPASAPPAVPPAPPPAMAAPAATPPQETPEAVCEKGIAAFEAGDLAGAEALLREAIGMNAALGVARSALGRVLAKAGHYEEASKELAEAVMLDPSDAAAFYVLGFTLKTLGMEHDAAEDYENFLELTPDAPEGPNIRSWIESVRSVQDLTPAQLLAEALSDFQAGRFDNAAATCEQVLATDEADAGANVLMGKILFEKGDYIRATTVLKRAEQASPDDSEIPFLLGQAYSQRGQADEAAQAFERCLQVAPSGAHAQAAREWLDSVRGSQATPAGGQCGYCFRTFPEEELTTHEGKMVCPDCLASLGVETGPQPATRMVKPTGMERAAAFEAKRAKRKRSGAKLTRVLLMGFLVLFLAVAVLLLVMSNGWLEGPLQKAGVYRAVRALGLEGALEGIGITVPSEAAPVPPTDRGDLARPADGDNGQTGPAARPLGIRGPTGPVAAMPLRPLDVKLEAQGGTGPASFRLLSGPVGLEVDSQEGTVRWRPPVVKSGGDKPDLPSKYKVEVEAAASRGEKATFAFEIVVKLAYKEGSLIDAGVSAGERMCLAVGKLNTTRDRDPDTIAVAWGRYREGFARLLYQSSPGRFTRGEPLPLQGQPSSLVVADITGDGRADAVVANWYRSRLHVLRQDEAGNMAQGEPLPAARGVGDLAVGDVDGDGMMDVVATHWAAPEVGVYLQRAEGDAAGRLVGPTTKTTTRVSGWNRVFVGPLSKDPKEGHAVYLLCGSEGEPFFKVFRVKDDKTLAPYEPSKDPELLPGRPVEAQFLRLGNGRRCIAALVGGEEPSLHLLGAKGLDVEEVARADIDLDPFPVAMCVADLNSDGADDVAVLSPEKLTIHINAGDPAGPFHLIGVVDIPGGTGPLAVGEFTGDGIRDLLVAREDGKLQVVKATMEVLP